MKTINTDTTDVETSKLNFRHPITGEPLKMDEGGDLIDGRGERVFISSQGSYDFVADAASKEERAHYDQEYSDGGWTTKEALDQVDYGVLWDAGVTSPDYMQSMGDLAGKRILLLGNGTSVKEFLFVRQGAQVTFTDLSFEAVKYAKRRYQESALGKEHPAGCEFHAVNAYYLPFADNSFDVICADAVIHHMEDLQSLFAGIHRCLKPGGRCRFGDTAYSPLWQGAKRGVLRALQRRVHQKHGISPEDQKATERGGYTEVELEQLRAKVGFKSLYYSRVGLLDYLLWRARCKLEARWMLLFRPLARCLDWLLTKTPVMRKQGIALVFGFDK